MARRDPLDTSLMRLCSLAEKTTVLLREIDHIRAGFHAFRFDPDALADELTRLARTGRAAHSDRLDGRRVADVASEEARELAQSAYEALAGFRLRLATAATLEEDPVAADDLRVARRRMYLRSPRLTGGLDLYRRGRDHLARTDHPVHRHTMTATLRDELAEGAERMEAALAARDDALRTRRIAVNAARVARERLRTTLRRIRQMAEIAATLPNVHGEVLSYLQTRPAPKPSRGPDTSLDAGTTPHEDGTTPHECGTTPRDAGTTPHEAGTTPHEAGTTPHEPG